MSIISLMAGTLVASTANLGYLIILCVLVIVLTLAIYF